MHLSHVFAGQNVGVTQVGERIRLVTFMRDDLGYFDDETGDGSPPRESTMTAASASAGSTTRQNGFDHSCTMFCVSGDRSA